MSALRDIRPHLKERLLDLSPRAFELFAGDLLAFVGLEDIEVTRYINDGGIDAHGVLVSQSGLIRIPTGVQVKRHRKNVGRDDIDRFIGALSNRYAQGIFVTTAGYAPQALDKAGRSIPYLSPIDGDHVVRLMVTHSLGVVERNQDTVIDEGYFLAFEEQKHPKSSSVAEKRSDYRINEAAENKPESINPADDLISLKSLSYSLRIDENTLRRWIAKNKLVPAQVVTTSGQDRMLFRRDNIDRIRQEMLLPTLPQTAAEWRQEFLAFSRSRNLSKSYKPVFIKAMFRPVNRGGEVPIAALAKEFRAFYLQRHLEGLPSDLSESGTDNLGYHA